MPPPVGSVVCGGGYQPSTYVSATPTTPELHVFGVYQPSNAGITVSIDRPGMAVTVVLSSYESNYWASCAYQWMGNCNTAALISGAEAESGLDTTTFTGCDEASAFDLQ